MSIWQTISETLTAIGDSVLSYLARLTKPAENDPLNSVAFTIGMIALGAKMAKADGVVTADEVAAFKQVFHVPQSELSNVARVFNLAKTEVAGYEAYASQVARLFDDRPEILEDVIDGLFHIAKADGVVKQSEIAYLQSVAGIFGLDDRFRCIKARHIKSPDDDPYVVLGVDPCIDDQELKRLYRQIIRENHPDRHVAAGMPQEMINIATERMAEINSAWDAISKERGL